MAVTVVISRDDNGAPMTREVYADANKYVIDQGNLDVVIQGQGGLASFPSGNWLSVYMDDTVEVITTKPEESSDDSSSDFDFGSSDDTDLSFDSDDSDTDSDDSDSEDSDTDSDEES
jgi:hypothetical protein